MFLEIFKKLLNTKSIQKIKRGRSKNPKIINQQKKGSYEYNYMINQDFIQAKLKVSEQIKSYSIFFLFIEQLQIIEIYKMGQVQRIFYTINESKSYLIFKFENSKRNIIIWNVDFIKNELNFQYSLDQHSNQVHSFSFNSSETVLVSCGYNHFIIWEKGIQGKWEFKYRKDVSDDGRKIYLINDQQLLWVTFRKNIDAIFVFEIQNGVFELNINKTIKLTKNNECDDNLYFPIIYNKDKNIILVRHKHHIYLIRQLNNDTFNIIVSLNCQNDQIYGTMTNNGQYLVFWDNIYKKYKSYEILHK
ncbi:unnamed protein product [Paramecium pentaurelia]|uniref:Uncharacterized protein n=1 Tax=Paramecium pentaurelia TaxID=43138 RepID=A0A8S1YJP1_9CILI|nr:unnamed protein product [Paramecium pentaurelia]